MRQDIEIGRRGMLGGAAAGVALFATGATGTASVAVPTGRGRARFLGSAEMATLTALVDRIVPGVPEDTTPGAVEAGCADAIDALLGAFTANPRDRARVLLSIDESTYLQDPNTSHLPPLGAYGVPGLPSESNPVSGSMGDHPMS